MRSLELYVVRSQSRLRISFEYVNCLQAPFKKHCQDDLIQKMKLHCTKVTYLATNAIGNSEEEAIDLFKQCPAFAIGFDESEVSKTSELEILVKIATRVNKIMLRQYKTINLECSNANAIINTIIETFEDDGISYESKCTGTISDGCNVNKGDHNTGILN